MEIDQTPPAPLPTDTITTTNLAPLAPETGTENSPTPAADVPPALAEQPAAKTGTAKVFNAQKVLVNVYRELENDDYKVRAEKLAAKVKGTVEFE